MMALFLDPTLEIAGRVFLALLFVVAAVPKLLYREEFYGVVRNFRLTPAWLTRPLALALPVLEAAVALGLVMIPVAGIAATAAGVLLVIFGAAVAVNVLRGRTAIDCGCFRNGMKQPLSWLLVGRNAVLAGLAFAIAGRAGEPLAASTAQVAVGLAAGALCMLLYTSVSLLGGLPTSSRGRTAATGRA